MKPSSPALAAAAVCLALLATACGGQDRSEAGSADEPVEITYWSWMPGTKEMTAEFNRTHKNIKVVFSEIPAGLNGGYDKLAKAVKAGNAPDVVNVEYQALPDLVTQGLLRDSSAELADTVEDYAPSPCVLWSPSAAGPGPRPTTSARRPCTTARTCSPSTAWTCPGPGTSSRPPRRR
ncbi:hypothetical protein DN402_34040 [Streptomyces sp. SW4]|nr:hypothetical protein DN402_34040 [Streptomyces sp. SW4]